MRRSNRPLPIRLIWTAATISGLLALTYCGDSSPTGPSPSSAVSSQSGNPTGQLAQGSSADLGETSTRLQSDVEVQDALLFLPPVCDVDGPGCAEGYGIFCNPATDICEAMPGLDESCNDWCWPLGDLYCDSSGTCAARVGSGGACERLLPDDFGGCQLGLECDQSNICVQPVVPICQ